MNKKTILYVIMCLVMCYSVFAVSTTTCGDGTINLTTKTYDNSVVNTWYYWNSSNNTRAYAITSIVLRNNATLNITDYDTSPMTVGSYEVISYTYLNDYSFRVWNGSFGTNEIPQRNDYSNCSQETANASKYTDGVCGLNYTGTYAWTEGWVDVNDTFDGSILTSGVMNGTVNATLYVNYTKPVGATGAIWAVSDGDMGVPPWMGLAVPTACWQAYTNKLVLQVISGNESVTGYSEWMCYNGVAWVDMRYRASAGAEYITEEWMLWEIDGSWNISTTGSGVYLFRIVGRDANNTAFNVSFTRNVSSGFDLHSSDVTALCGAGCPSYETNLSMLVSNYNINGNWSNKNAWRVYNPYFGGNNWTLGWSEYPLTCTTVNSDNSNCQNTKTTIFAAFALLAVVGIAASAFVIINMFGGNLDGTAIMTVAVALIGLAVILFVGYYIIGSIASTTCIAIVG
jgi:hypothetical protein